MRAFFCRMALLCLIAGMGTGCATTYQSSSFAIAGGYSEEKISEDTWRVVFSGNGYTTRETAQTYWLYRAAELTAEKGYTYFEILNSLSSGITFWKEGLESVALASVIFIPMDSSSKPHLEIDIKMYKKPFTPKPPKSFEAKSLMSALEPYVKGKKCNSKNVCPHEKAYLNPTR